MSLLEAVQEHIDPNADMLWTGRANADTAIVRTAVHTYVVDFCDGRYDIGVYADGAWEDGFDPLEFLDGGPTIDTAVAALDAATDADMEASTR